MKARNVKAESFNLINQDYAWGQDSKKDFTWSMEKLYPAAKPGEDQLPKFGAGQYGTEISALMAKPADVTHSSLWGGDLQAFILQAAPRGLFKKSQVVLSAADHVLPALGDKVPDGTIIGARGAYGLMSPKSALNDWWWAIYQKANNVYPVQAPYRMAQALLGLKLAVEKAMVANAGKKPTPEQIAAALKGSEWDSPAGRIRMALGDGHQAVQETAIGKTRFDAAKKMVVIEDIQRFPAECVNPPATMKSEEWIKAGFHGAKC
jgi:branched-chain amino acid transport system substrate-binding protein